MWQKHNSQHTLSICSLQPGSQFICQCSITTESHTFFNGFYAELESFSIPASA